MNRQAGREADGADVARTHDRIPLRVRCNGRVGGVGGWATGRHSQEQSSDPTFPVPLRHEVTDKSRYRAEYLVLRFFRMFPV